MTIRTIGAFCILCACAYTGFAMAGAYRAQTQAAEMLDRALEVMMCQMEYRLTELPELCDILSAACTGPVRSLFGTLSSLLKQVDRPDTPICMALAVDRTRDLPRPCGEILNTLGTTLGKGDLDSELRSLAYARSQVQNLIAEQKRTEAGRVKSYRALGLCGGAALAILFI